MKNQIGDLGDQVVKNQIGDLQDQVLKNQVILHKRAQGEQTKMEASPDVIPVDQFFTGHMLVLMPMRSKKLMKSRKLPKRARFRKKRMV